jgi:VanZ family protein
VRVRWWLPPLLWTAVILAASSDAFSSGSTGGTMRGLLEALLGPLSDLTFEVIQFVIRKLTHLLAYGLLGALTLRAIRRGRTAWNPRWLLAALAYSLVIAIIDETHQSLIPSRTGSLGDVVIDFAGAVVAGMVMRRRAVSVVR